MQKFYKNKISSHAQIDTLNEELENPEQLLTYEKKPHSFSVENEDFIKLIRHNKESFTQRTRQIEASQEGSVPLNLAQIQYFHNIKSTYLREIKMTAEYRGSHSPNRRKISFDESPRLPPEKIIPSMSLCKLKVPQKKVKPSVDIVA